MSTGLLLAYLATCILLAVTPGPNMALIIANTLAGGFRAGLATVIGTSTGLAILVTIATVGMTSLMVLMAEWFDVVRWVGALYLVYLGLRQLWQYLRGPSEAAAPPRVSAASHYAQGLLVALSNPKVLLFLGAFLPQFVTPGPDPGPQLAVLGVVFVVVLGAVDMAYSMAIARARKTIDPARLRVLDGVSGGLLIAGGLLLAATRRP